VSWHVVTRTGRDLTGSLSFTVASSGAATAADPAADPAAEPGAGGHQHGGPDSLTGALLGVNVLAVAVLGVMFVRSGRRRRQPAGRQ
jgi:hypothetical protein